jgi:nitrogen fixation/metabolism regulation signal transduction histidine kinase
MKLLSNFRQKTADFVSAVILINNALLAVCIWIAHHYWHIQTDLALIFFICGAVLLALLTGWIAANYIYRPMALITQLISHISADGEAVAAPNIKDAFLGRELVALLAKRIHQLSVNSAQLTDSLDTKNNDLYNNVVAKSLPLPLFILNQDSLVVFANKAALKFIRKTESEVLGRKIHLVLNMVFKDKHDLNEWLARNQTGTVTASKKWTDVRLNQANSPAKPQLFDLAAHYNRNHPYGHELMLVLFDHPNV